MGVRTKNASPKAGSKLDRIEAKIRKARERLREIEAEARAAQAEVERLDAALEEHFAEDGNDPEPSGLLGERAVALERASEPWAAKVRGQRRMVERLEGERERFVREHWGELAAEQMPEAEERRTVLIESLRAMDAAIREYEEQTSRAVRLAVAAGADDVPRLHGGDQLRQAIRQMLAREVPLPMPRSLVGEPPEEEKATVTAGTVTDLAEGE